MPWMRPSPAVHIAHDVAREIGGRNDLDRHDRLKQRRARFLHPRPEGLSPGELESQLRGVYIVILAVIQLYFEIDHGIARQVPGRGGLDNAFLDRRYVGLRNRAAKDFVDELEPTPVSERFHADTAITKLPVPAGLLLVAALHLGAPADRLAIRNLRRLELDLHVVAFLKPADDNLQMLLPVAGQQKFLGLRVAVEIERRVLFENFVNAAAETVFVVSRLGLNGVGDRRQRNLGFGEFDRVGLVPEAVAGQSVLEFRDRSQVARVNRGDGREFLAQRDGDAGETLVGVLREIGYVVVIIEDARDDP